MIYANDECGNRVTATPNATATCPSCDAGMVAKCGRIKVWHWAHQSLRDCDTWSEGETLWHAAWKSRFQGIEVTMRKGIGGVEHLHRADVVTPLGTVIEFQHSAISSQDIADRERFYGNMVWVLDATTTFRKDRILLRHEQPQSGSPFCKFIWSHRRTSFDEAAASVFLDLGMACRDIGKWFYKPSHWWDDTEGGMRDGIRREPGFWQRVQVSPMLIEVRKMRGGAGWGKALTHDEFCRLHGGICGPESRQAKRGLRLVQGAYSRGYERTWPPVQSGDYYPFSSIAGLGGIAFKKDYEWCEKELHQGVIA